MQITTVTTGVSKISKTVKRNLTFILMLLFSHKVAFIENKAKLLCVTIQKRARAFTATV